MTNGLPRIFRRSKFIRKVLNQPAVNAPDIMVDKILARVEATDHIQSCSQEFNTILRRLSASSIDITTQDFEVRITRRVNLD